MTKITTTQQDEYVSERILEKIRHKEEQVRKYKRTLKRQDEDMKYLIDRLELQQQKIARLSKQVEDLSNMHKHDQAYITKIKKEKEQVEKSRHNRHREVERLMVKLKKSSANNDALLKRCEYLEDMAVKKKTGSIKWKNMEIQNAE